LVVAEERGCSCEGDCEFVAVDNRSEVPDGGGRCAGRLKNCQHSAASVGNRDHQRYVDGYNCILDYGVYFRGSKWNRRRRRDWTGC